jgi:hypothetical protein
MGYRLPRNGIAAECQAWHGAGTAALWTAARLGLYGPAPPAFDGRQQALVEFP